ncbi:retinoic acid receptor RXR-alpha-B [Argonauta hians]
MATMSDNNNTITTTTTIITNNNNNNNNSCPTPLPPPPPPPPAAASGLAEDGDEECSKDPPKLIITMPSPTPAQLTQLPPTSSIHIEVINNNNNNSTNNNSTITSSPALVVSAVADTDLSGNSTDHSANSSSMDQSGNMGYCLVCSDLGSGYHYSAFSCEGCKGFFKRTVQKNLAYRCKDSGHCTINKFTRNSCQHCRFQRCIQVGMKRDAVREDRTPGGKHRHKRRRVENILAESDDGGGGIGVGGGGGGVVSGGGGGGVVKNCDSLLERIISAAPDRIPNTEEIFSGEVKICNLTGNELLQCGYLELKYIIDWAKKVPGFRDLCISDQTSLLKSSFMELSVLRLSYRSMGMENVIKFAEGLLVPINYATTMGWGNELITASVDFSLCLNNINLDHSEFCILNALVLTYPDASGVQDKQKVAAMQTTILDTLRRYVCSKYCNDVQRYGKMLLRLPALRTLSAKAAERFLSLTLEGSFHINELVSQMIS